MTKLKIEEVEGLLSENTIEKINQSCIIGGDGPIIVKPVLAKKCTDIIPQDNLCIKPRLSAVCLGYPIPYQRSCKK